MTDSTRTGAMEQWFIDHKIGWASVEERQGVILARQYDTQMARQQTLIMQLREALGGLVALVDLQREIYGYEKQQFIIDEVPQWERARAALAAASREDA